MLQKQNAMQYAQLKQTNMQMQGLGGGFLNKRASNLEVNEKELNERIQRVFANKQRMSN